MPTVSSAKRKQAIDPSLHLSSSTYLCHFAFSPFTSPLLSNKGTMPPNQTCCSYNNNSDNQSHSTHLHSDSPSFIPQSNHHHHPTAHHRCIATLTGHATYTCSLTLAGKFLYTGSSNKEIRLLKRSALTSETHHKNPPATAVGGKGAVKSLAVSSDKLFTAHQDHKIRVWQIVEHLAGNHKLTQLATLPTLTDRAVKLLTPKNYVQIRRHKRSTWVHHVDAVSALALSNNESLLYSVSWDRTLKIWRTTDFKCLESVENAHDDAINAVELSNDGFVYTGSADKKIKVWRKSSGEKTKHSVSLVGILEKHESGVNALALSGDGSVLFSGAGDRSVVVWEKEGAGGMVVVGALWGHGKAVLCLAVVGDLVCSGSADKTVRIWKGGGRGGGGGGYCCLGVLEGHRGPVKCVAAARGHYGPCNDNVDDDDDDDHEESSYVVYSGSLDCDIRVWRVFVPPSLPI